MLHNSGAWLQVSLPIAPNGQTGWVKTSQVTLSQNDYRVDILRTAHQLRVYRDNVLQKAYPIAVGTADTPTPGGTYFIKVLLTPPNPNGDYGPYAYGLSGYSAVLTQLRRRHRCDRHPRHRTSRRSSGTTRATAASG